MNLKNTTEYVLEIAKEAGEILLEFYNKEYKFSTKNKHNDYVTDADLASEKHIIQKLQERFPLFSILAEETGEQIFEDSEYTWIIDPLDGTTNFLHKLDIFSVNIALKHKDEIIIGVTHCPVLQKTYYAYKNGGAYLNEEKIQVSKTKNVKTCIVATGFPYIRKGELYDKTKQFIINAANHCKSIRRFGAASYDMALVAESKIDAYFEFTLKPYDMAPGTILIQEAGGAVTNSDGSPVDIYGQNLISSNGIIQKELIEILNKPLS